MIAGATGESVGQVGDGSRKDIRDAVEAAHSAAKGWGKRAAYNRSQILYYVRSCHDASVFQAVLGS